jgi:epoxide hydrolase-like predicted phosphatase
VRAWRGQPRTVVPEVDAVVFDYGGVLTTPVRDSIRAWLDRDRIDPASFSAALKAWMSRSAAEGTPVHRLETGELRIADFDALLAAELVAVDGGQVEPVDLLKGLFADMRPDPAMFDLVADVKAAGVQVALLSNSWGNTYPRDHIDAVFSPVVISGEVGMRKPNRDIFVHTLDLLGLPPERVVLVDDAEPNTEGARRAGMDTVLHGDAETTRTELARLVPSLDRRNHEKPRRAQ